ncbi:hypothetical protein ABOM_007325 [Aspergillus bombycis]|uniref:Uncharacterized protein n=1 Tax=Aspergillus bombycis TaxID=109264 RepID=A0A1F7ZX88_9EURO|nr:hypothetical protein ABOM_007325 [Aspergillus bombycis]OGM44092.1 hypothetical protein ABOM_007325 [Aspergillus bombycis]
MGRFDSTPEKKVHGATIRAAHIEYETKTRCYGHVDCPEYADHIKNIISGEVQMDGAILVVSATGKRLKQVETKVRELLRTYDYPGNDVPIIKSSAHQALDAYITEPEQAVTGPFLVPVEETFPTADRGHHATGRVERGVIRIGDKVEIVGMSGTARTVCMGVEMFRKSLDMGQAVHGFQSGSVRAERG